MHDNAVFVCFLLVGLLGKIQPFFIIDMFNKRLTGHYLNILTDIGLKMCARECLARTDCMSINYGIDYLTCELNHEHNLSDITVHEKFVYTSRKSIIESMEGNQDPCRTNDICPEHNKCVRTTTPPVKVLCVISDCSENQDITDDKYKLKSFNGRQVGMVLENKCKERAINVWKTSICTTNGTWKALTSCPYCDPIPEVPNARVTNEDRQAGGIIEYQCDPCYKGSGDMTSTCEGDGTWSTVEGTCLIITCTGSPNSIPNGKLIIGNNVCGAKWTYQCNSGYEMINPIYSTCIESTVQISGRWGYWTFAHGHCTRICPTGYTHNADLFLCWKVSEEFLHYDLAMSSCQNEPGGRLIILETQAKMEYIQNELKNSYNDSSYWINGKVDNGIWKYSNGQDIDMDSTYWRTTTDPLPMGLAYCVLLVPVTSENAFEWKKYSCNIQYLYICEVDVT